MDYREYILVSVLWIGYCAVHSALISTTFTEFVKRKLGEKACYHRIFFNVFSLVSIIPLLIHSRSTGSGIEPLFAWDGTPLSIAKYVLIALAAVIALAVGSRYSLRRFLGLEQIRGRAGRGMTEGGGIDSSGILGIIRHPWYVAVFILLWVGDLTPLKILINVILSGYLVIGTFLEERKLVLEFGDSYRKYQADVSMFVPLKWLKSKLRRGYKKEEECEGITLR